MDIDNYEDLSGLTVADRQRTRVSAYIERARAMLEAQLGYTLDPDKVGRNLYNEVGKAATEALCADVAAEDLLDPDDVQGAYRVFDFNEKDPYWHIDPYSAVYAVKLVRGDVTLVTLDADDYATRSGRDGVARFLDVSDHFWPRWGWPSLCKWTGLQVAVDADWLWPDNDDEEDSDSIPQDLQLLWADMVTFYANPKNGVKSETVGSHSYAKFDYTPPETLPANAAILREYAGPRGLAARMPV